MTKKNTYKVSYEPYEQKMSPLWWTKDLSGILYIIREISSLFISLFSILLVIWLTALFLGEQYYEKFLEWMYSFTGTSFLFLTFIFSIIHTISWFNAIPQAINIKFQGKEIPDKCIMMICYGIFIIVTLVTVVIMALKFSTI